MSANYFTVLSDIDISQHVKQKGQFSYLSWPYAVQTLGEHHPDAHIEVHRFPLLGNPEIEVPYLKTPIGYFVEVSVTIGQVTRSQIHPVLSYNNTPIENPSVFDINTSLQRALVKAVAMHGLGLFVYQGEDLPLNAPDYTPEQFEIFNELIAEDDALGLYVFAQNVPLNTAMALHNSFKKGEKMKMKELVNQLLDKGRGMVDEYVLAVRLAIENNDKLGLEQLVNELGEATKKIVWEALDQEDRYSARELLK